MLKFFYKVTVAKMALFSRFLVNFAEQYKNV